MCLENMRDFNVGTYLNEWTIIKIKSSNILYPSKISHNYIQQLVVNRQKLL